MTLAAVAAATVATGSWSPHLSAIVDAHDPVEPLSVVRARVFALVELGLLDRQGETLDFALSEVGQRQLDEVEVRS